MTGGYLGHIVCSIVVTRWFDWGSPVAKVTGLEFLVDEGEVYGSLAIELDYIASWKEDCHRKG